MSQEKQVTFEKFEEDWMRELAKQLHIAVQGPVVKTVVIPEIKGNGNGVLPEIEVPYKVFAHGLACVEYKNNFVNGDKRTKVFVHMKAIQHNYAKSRNPNASFRDSMIYVTVMNGKNALPEWSNVKGMVKHDGNSFIMRF